MSFFTLLLSLICLYVIPYYVGESFYILNNRSQLIINKYVFGNFFIFALMQLIGVPLVLLKASFSVFYILVVLVIYGFIAYGLIKKYLKNSKKKKKKKKKNKKKQKKKKIKFEFAQTGYLIIVGVIILLVYLLSLSFQSNTLIDQNYLAGVGDIVNSKKMFLINPLTGEELKGFTLIDSYKNVVSPWMLYLAYVVRFSHIKLIIVMNVIMPLYLLVLMVSTLWMFLNRLIGKKTSYKAMFVVLFILLILASKVNMNNIAYLLFVCPYKGEAFLALVAILYMYINMYDYFHHSSNKNLFRIIICDFSMCFMTNGGIYIGLLMLLIYVGIYTILKKNYKHSIMLGLLIIPNIFYILLTIVVRSMAVL